METFNRLGSEKSPYLLQHQHNPVHWFPWGEEAFKAAASLNRPIFLSIGYSTCYWCHVMEKDSFEIQAVADVLNRDFVCIKVDREERPDVDEIYMDAVVSMTGQGGWPMSVFLTPEGKPFFAGTYFPRARFLDLLSRIVAAWKEQKSAIESTGENVLEHFRSRAEAMLAEPLAPSPLDVLNKKIQAQALSDYASNFDSRDGGFGAAPKFPPAQSIGLLLRIHRRTGDPEALAMSTTTLDRMACGGIFDQVGGGFHRYSTDEKWLVPHFEKMLYDNALLSNAYTEAYQSTGNELYRDVVQLTLEYVLREMKSAEGGFFSAQDAGEVHREGEYYVWDYNEVVAVVGDSAAAELCAHLGLSREGNFEGGTTILHWRNPALWKLRHRPDIAAALEKLRARRFERKPPHLDDKILTSWNGLMIQAMAKAYQAFGRQSYLLAAQDAARFLKTNLWRNEHLLRRYRDGSSGIDATLEDYTYLIYGLLELYAADFDSNWLDWAIRLQAKQEALFDDPISGAYFSATTSDPHLVFRKRDAYDGATPSANSVAALNLEKLARYCFQPSYSARAERLRDFLRRVAERAPNAIAFGLQAFDFAAGPTQEIAIIGHPQEEGTVSFVQTARQGFHPHRLIACGTSDAVPMLAAKRLPEETGTDLRAYVCKNGLCLAPSRNLAEFQQALSET